MPKKEKKYNVWIVYSDLFSNLSTFLFISAFGAFAAIGSGVVGPSGLGSDQSCAVPRLAETSLLETPAGSSQPPSLLNKIGDATDGRDACRRYYHIDGARFQTKYPSLRHFEIGGQEVPEGDLLSRVCQPVWLLISRRDFRERGGRVTFRGIVPAVNEPPLEQFCRSAGRPPVFGDWRTPTNRPITDVVAVCRSGEDPASYCKPILQCLRRREGDRHGSCRRLFAAIEWYERAAHSCDEQFVGSQARAIWQLCEGAPRTGNFQDQLYDDEETFVDEARNGDVRPVLWEQVDYGVYTRTTTDQPASETNRALNSMPQGSIAVEVTYTR